MMTIGFPLTAPNFATFDTIASMRVMPFTIFLRAIRSTHATAMMVVLKNFFTLCRFILTMK